MTRDERLPGATFALADIGFIDFESRGALPITVGTDRYSRAAQAVVLAWAIGDGPVGIVAVTDFSAPLKWSDMPAELVAFVDRVNQGNALLCAHNASFDRAIWHYATDGFPWLEPWAFIDTRVQAAASGLPAKLEHAAKFSGADILKDKAGQDLIKQFCLPASLATPQSHPDDWAAFLRYARTDVEAMRGLFQHTRQLPLAEWREYWAAEAINDGGVMIDLPMVTAAAKMARQDKRLANDELFKLTDGAVNTVDEVKRIREWLVSVLPADGRAILVKTEEDIDVDTKEVIKPGKDALDRQRVVRLLAYLDALESPPAPLQAARRVLQIRLYGGSKTPAKFSRMLDSHVDGIIGSQYVFNGASQTGRFSARGIQVHNLARDPLPYELDAIDALVAGCTPDEFAKLGDDTPISRKLSLLIRPSLIAAPGSAFVWGDWANIEARITPWLARDREAEERLGVFADVDAGVEPYDIYTRTAATLSGLSLEEAKEPPIRQRGKVVELACVGHGTEVLTDRGYVEIQNVKRQDRVWDGVTWVGHCGLVQRGDREVLRISGAALTPDHLVLCGSEWKPSQFVAQDESILCQALATGLANCPLPGSSRGREVGFPPSLSSATAGLTSILSRLTTFAMAALSGAIAALENSRSALEKCIGSTPPYAPMTSIGGDCSTASLPASIAARTQSPPSIATTAGAASAYTLHGWGEAATEKPPQAAEVIFFAMWSGFRGGTIRLWNWIAPTSTGGTSRATCASSPKPKTSATSGGSDPCKPASSNSKQRLLTYDLAYSGPRNRYAIRTDLGPLIVHNCGFGGGTNALLSMAASYGMFLSEEDAKAAVDRWRLANPWAPRYWAALWAAATLAIETPGQFIEVGRVGYVYLRQYLGGSLLCRLPSGRFLTYRRIKWELVNEVDDDGKIVDVRRELMFSRDMGRIKLWKGLLMENAVQAIAADILRGTLVRLDSDSLPEWMPVVLHTHDEVVCEVVEDRAAEAGERLKNQMEAGFAWTPGLPIVADTVIARFYTKNKTSIGL